MKGLDHVIWILVPASVSKYWREILQTEILNPIQIQQSVNEARYLTFLIGNISNHDNSKCYLLNRFQKDVFYWLKRKWPRCISLCRNFAYIWAADSFHRLFILEKYLRRPVWVFFFSEKLFFSAFTTQYA